MARCSCRQCSHCSGTGVELDVVTPDPVDEGPHVRRHQLPPGDARLRELFRRADVLCLPTFRDAVPWVVLESFASGTPVIASDIGALPELVGRSPNAGRWSRLVTRSPSSRR